jgi:hypothetical protein
VLLHKADELLARLYVDARLRSELAADRETFAERYTLDGAFVAGLDPKQLESFAKSLVCKRANEVRKLLPLTATVLGDEFEQEFDAFAAGAIPAGYKKHGADAIAFCRHIRAKRGGLAYEAARFEAMKVGLQVKCTDEGGDPRVVRAAARRLPWARLARFPYELRELLERRPENERLERKTIVLFLSLRGLNGIWYW